MEGVDTMFLGEVYMTRGIVNLIGEGVITKNEAMRCLSRHQRGDYGLTCIEDVRVNERNLNHNSGTVMSEYVVNGIRTWYITSLGDSETTYTTILLPEEY